MDSGQIILDKTHELVFSINNQQEEKILIRIAPYPSWKISIDGQEAPYTNKNALEVSVPSGEHTVRTSFQSTPIETIANYISFISAFLVIGGILLRKVHGKTS